MAWPREDPGLWSSSAKSTETSERGAATFAARLSEGPMIQRDGKSGGRRRLWQGSAIGRRVARILFSSVSSSGGGLPGRPGLERVQDALIFWLTFPAAYGPHDSAASPFLFAGIQAGSSIRGDREVDGDPCLGLDRFRALQV